MDQLWQAVFPRSVEFLNQRGQGGLLVEFESELDAQGLFKDEGAGSNSGGSISAESVSADSVSSWTMCEKARWFPAFLKIKSCPTYWLEIAEFEYLQFAARNLDFGSPQVFQSRPVLHPSAQFVELRHDHAELNRERGLYCFVKRGTRFLELQLSLRQALILDLVQQGLVVSAENLIEIAEDSLARIEPHAEVPASQWMELMDQLTEIGILVIGDSTSSLGS